MTNYLITGIIVYYSLAFSLLVAYLVSIYMKDKKDNVGTAALSMIFMPVFLLFAIIGSLMFVIGALLIPVWLPIAALSGRVNKEK